MSYNSILASAPLTTQNYHLKMIGTTIGNSLIWDNGTNVGIGNTNTTYNFDVTGTGRFTGNVTIGATNPYLILNRTAATNYSAISYTTNGTNNWLAGTNVTTAGSGTNYEFYSYGASTNPVLSLNYSTGAATFKVNADRNLAIKYDTNIAISAQADAGGPESLRMYADTFRIFTSTTAVGLTERFTISNTGNVGIGTSSPNVGGSSANDTVLTIAGKTTGYGGTLEFQMPSFASTSGDMGFIKFFNGTTENARIYANPDGANTDSGKLLFYTRATGGSLTERMRISSAGRTTIKGSTANSSEYALVVENSTPANLFLVRNDGNINTGLLSASPYNSSATGRTMIIESTGGLGYLVSTRESKANIESIKSIDFINQLNPVQFNYRKKDTDTNEFTDELYDNITYGFIADEVEKVNKELVFYNSDGTTLAGVEYNSMIAILTKAVQEQNKIITSLQDRLDKLENK